MPDLSLDSSNRILAIPAPLHNGPSSRQEQGNFEDVLQSTNCAPGPCSQNPTETTSSKQTSNSDGSNDNSEKNSADPICAQVESTEESTEQTEITSTTENQKSSSAEQKKKSDETEKEKSDQDHESNDDTIAIVIAPEVKIVKAVVEEVEVPEGSEEKSEAATESDEVHSKKVDVSTKQATNGKNHSVKNETYNASLPLNENSNAPIQKYDQETVPLVATHQEQSETTSELVAKQQVEDKTAQDLQQTIAQKAKSKKNSSTKDEQPVEKNVKGTDEKHVEKKAVIVSVEQTQQESDESTEQKPARETNHSSQNDTADSKSATAANIVAAIDAKSSATALTTSEKSTDNANQQSDSNAARATQDITASKSANQNETRTPIVPPALLQRRDEAQSANQNRNDGSLSEIERVRLVQRVAKAFHSLGNNEGEMRLRLSPPELGAVKLEVSYREGVLHARLETESTSTRNVIMENLPQLKERLAEQNVRIETFDVNVRDQNSGNDSQQQHDFAREQMERARARAQNQPNQSAQIARATTNTITRNISLNQNSTQLNVII